MWTTPAVVLPGDTNSLAIVWSLAQAGVPVIALVTERDCPHRWSRYPHLRIPLKSDAPSDLLDALARVPAEGAVLMAAADWHVAFLSAHRERLGGRFRIAGPGPDLIASLLDKRLELPLLESLGIAIPRTVTRFPASPKELEDNLGLPLIVKPRSFSHRRGLSFKTMVIRDRQALKDFCAASRENQDALIAQEVIPGGDSALWKCDSTFNRNCEMVAGFTFQKIRMAPAHFGVASLAMSRQNQEVLALTARIGNRLQYAGPMNIEFKYDQRDGTFRYIEINPRLGMCNYFDAVCGINNALYTYRLALGQDLAPDQPAQRNGVLYCSLFSDFYARLTDGESPGAIVQHYLELRRHPRVGAFFSWRDPVPGLVHGCGQLLAAGRSFAGKRRVSATNGPPESSG